MMRRDIRELHDVDTACVLGYVCKGHVDPAEFVALVNDWFGRDLKPENVHQGYRRVIPFSQGRYGNSLTMICGPGRGAYEATWVQL